MKDVSIRLPELESGSLRLCYRVAEAETLRQNKNLKKLQCDNINAMCEIKTLEMRVRGSEEYVKTYRRQIDELTSTIKNLNDKHRQEVESLKESQAGLERRIAALTRENESQKNVILSLKLQNEMLQRQLNSSKQTKLAETARIKPRLPSAQKSVKRSTSRSSTKKENSKNQ